MNDVRREAMRKQALDEIPASYSPWLHLAVPLGSAGLVITGAVLLVSDWGLDDLAFVVVIWVLSNAAEWRIHRDVLHHKLRGFEWLFERHTPHHHAIFPGSDMSVRSRREWRFVLLPPWATVLLLLVNAPIVGVIAAFGFTDKAALFAATAAAYIASYEGLHLAYHLPPDSVIGRNGLVRWLRKHHAAHHETSLMQRWNFNVTLPLWDWVRGTIFPGQKA